MGKPINIKTFNIKDPGTRKAVSKYADYLRNHHSACSRIDAYKESKSAADAESLVFHLQSLVIPGEVADNPCQG